MPEQYTASLLWLLIMYCISGPIYCHCIQHHMTSHCSTIIQPLPYLSCSSNVAPPTQSSTLSSEVHMTLVSVSDCTVTAVLVRSTMAASSFNPICFINLSEWKQNNTQHFLLPSHSPHTHSPMTSCCEDVTYFLFRLSDILRDTIRVAEYTRFLLHFDPCDPFSLSMMFQRSW